MLPLPLTIWLPLPVLGTHACYGSLAQGSHACLDTSANALGLHAYFGALACVAHVRHRYSHSSHGSRAEGPEHASA